MTQRSPSKRISDDGVGSLVPDESNYAPPLVIQEITDPETGEPVGCVIELTVYEAIMRGLANNLEIGLTSFEPAVSREQMTEAAAEFDVSFFGSAGLARDDVQTRAVVDFFDPDSNDPDVLATKTASYEAGFTQKLITGGVWSTSWQLSRVEDNNTALNLNKRYEPVLQVEFAQPLLRDGWPQFNLARFRVSQISHRVSRAQFRQSVEDVVTRVFGAYWQLAQAKREVEVRELVAGAAETTLNRLRLRRDIDARVAEISQAESALASRQARVIRARKIRQDVQDELARLLNDPQINLLTDCEIIPTTNPVESQFEIDQADQLMTALLHNPILEQAREAIAIADITVEVAENQTLPRLDFTASVSYQALAGSHHQAYQNFDSGDYESYSVAIRLEYPIGNREKLARLRQAELLKVQSVTELQNTADLVAQRVRERIREIETTYEELHVQRFASEAAMRQLRALEAQERLTGRLTPEFLNVKLSAQDSIAEAESGIARALANYNIAWYQLAQATGTVLELNKVKLALPAAMGEAAEPTLETLIEERTGEMEAPTGAPAKEPFEEAEADLVSPKNAPAKEPVDDEVVAEPISPKNAPAIEPSDGEEITEPVSPQNAPAIGPEVVE